MHTTTITRPDRAALENLWGNAGTWVVDTWTRLNATHFAGKLRYHGIVWGLTPHGHAYGHTSPTRRITLHPALLNPRGDAWEIREQLGTLFAADVLLHEMCHVELFDAGVENTEESHHNTQEWCDLIIRITPELGLWTVLAAPVKPRRVDGKVVRLPLDGHLSRDAIAHWPHSLRLGGYYGTDPETIRVPI
jgi:hypothetical protein